MLCAPSAPPEQVLSACRWLTVSLEGAATVDNLPFAFLLESATSFSGFQVFQEFHAQQQVRAQVGAPRHGPPPLRFALSARTLSAAHNWKLCCSNLSLM